jgi:hypothetical protein
VSWVKSKEVSPDWIRVFVNCPRCRAAEINDVHQLLQLAGSSALQGRKINRDVNFVMAH